ncbi:origin recognition complex subunit 4 C-terminus-domain-containing protein [Suillus clintonianus]|uniref:origin recognition complex subunit 4 C-terminus-domain-containing protein n=1 Tax=Suillus clintonianus TaxID=1904413 RepID=UPI001B85EA40|nr:origin recognition complex subunit 4 C-terminus-domain-containing protein [Suillus clintonianus]KAG2156091.1 origin recognition complex subunit 4 C-terminus-domain-containing protein [Suillus clintonianus]
MPKRKAPEDFDAPSEASPPKRATRASTRQNNSGLAAPSTRSSNSPQKVTREDSKSFQADAQLDVPVKSARPSRIRKKQPAARESPLKKTDASSPSKRIGKQSSNPITSLHRQEESANSDDADELNLPPSKLPVHCTTPPPRSQVGRFLLHSVEITTPRSFPKPIFTASPAPDTRQSSAKTPITTTGIAYCTAELATASPSRSSALQNVPPPQASSSRTNQLPSTPTRDRLQPKSPKKDPPTASRPHSPTRLPRNLPPHLGTCLRLQKRVMLLELQNCSMESDEDASLGPTNAAASQQLKDLLAGTVTRGEGNSCFVLGPRGSGKTALVDRAIASLNQTPIVIRLSGHAELNDRLALREIARQLSLQTGKTYLAELNGDDDQDDDNNPFLDAGPCIAIPPPSHLPALISVLTTLSRPVVVILDAFDLFALHARQALLYCLLDTAQSCRVGQGNNGIAVIGVTTRIDTINLLEKRVKSRFSGRMLRTAAPTELSFWMKLIERVFRAGIETSEEEWEPLWTLSIDNFIADRKVLEQIQETVAVTRDIRVLQRILVGVVAALTPSSPFPTCAQLLSAVNAQRIRDPFPHLSTLPYPSICLLIAAVHAHTAGHDAITFEMLYDAFREQYRASAAAPIQVAGGSIGMSRCTREVLMRGFEHLIGEKIFICVAASSTSIAPGFTRYRSALNWDDVKRAVDKMGKTSLKKWLTKAN